ncbi:olfactory receptor [Cricetulus griseus]|nr:olfactory receptor [Cricetulus griseus]
MTNRNWKQFLAYLGRQMEAGLPLGVQCLEKNLPSAYLITLERFYSQEQQHYNGCATRQGPDSVPTVEEL